MRALLVLVLSFTTASAAFGVDDQSQQVDQLFARFEVTGSPGCSVGVIRDGNFVYKKSFGEANLELRVPLTPASVFYLGSIAKQFTAASIVLAAEQNRLSLDDDVRKYLPELPDYGRPSPCARCCTKPVDSAIFSTSLSFQGGTPQTSHPPPTFSSSLHVKKG